MDTRSLLYCCAPFSPQVHVGDTVVLGLVREGEAAETVTPL
jgi:hypothetical protein